MMRVWERNEQVREGKRETGKKELCKDTKRTEFGRCTKREYSYRENVSKLLQNKGQIKRAVRFAVQEPQLNNEISQFNSGKKYIVSLQSLIPLLPFLSSLQLEYLRICVCTCKCARAHFIHCCLKCVLALLACDCVYVCTLCEGH